MDRITNNKQEILEFIARENDITRLFLMRLFVYCDSTYRALITDDSRINEITTITHIAHLQDILKYKLSLSKEILTLIEKQASNISSEKKSYLSFISSSTNEKEKTYSILDDRLFCYYLWTHTVKEKIINNFNINVFSNEDEKISYKVNDKAFKGKLAMFHEQRKLIVIFDLEKNITNPIDIERIKNNWREICQYGSVVTLEENNPDFVEWVLQYTIKFIESSKIYKGKNIEISPLFYQQIITTKDKIETCYTLINAYIFKEESYLVEFKNKINLAIAQQERRNRTKKSLSPIKISKQYENKLKDLAKHQKKPKQKMLEELIDFYYEKITK